MSEVSLPRQEVVYNRNRPLESIFKNSPARVLDFLILNQNFDYSASEISTITGIPLRTVQRVMPHLVQKELVKETGKIGNTRMYIINSKSELSELLRQYILTRINIDIDKTRKQQDISKNNKSTRPDLPKNNKAALSHQFNRWGKLNVKLGINETIKSLEKGIGLEILIDKRNIHPLCKKVLFQYAALYKVGIKFVPQPLVAPCHCAIIRKK